MRKSSAGSQSLPLRFYESPHRPGTVPISGGDSRGQTPIERWSGGGATFVCPDDREEQDRPSELKYVAGSESARVIIVDETGQDIYAFMSEMLGSPEWLNYDLRLERRERIVVTTPDDDVDESATVDSLALA